MSRNRNLIPTVVTDKNGKLTTVHRKPSVTTGSSVAIPMPTVSQGITTHEARMYANEQLSAIGFSVHKNDRMNTNLMMLSEDSPETLKEVVDHILHAGDQERLAWNVAMSRQIYYREDSDQEIDGKFAREMYLRRMAVSGIASVLKTHNGSFHKEGAPSLLIENAIRLTWNDPGEDYSHLKAMTIYLYFRPEWEEYDAPLEELDGSSLEPFLQLSRHIDAVVQSLDMVKSRKTIDPSLITEIANNHPAMSEGIL